MGDYASKGVAGSGLGLGIAGTALALLNGNGLGGLFGNNCALNTMASSATVASLAEKDAEIGQLKAEKYTNDKLGETYIALNNQINKVAGDLATLSLNNERRIAGLEGQVSCLAQATNTAIAGINNTLGTITKTVVPIGAVCPEPMPAKNTWVAPTTTPTTGA
nr:MAG TPA: hypothetical protein [Caudoviricetes sp.]